MSESAPGFTLTDLRAVSARLEPYDWPWARTHASDIARNWERRRAARPALFDGTVLLCHACAVRDAVCEARFFEAPYSHFLAFRDAGSPDSAVANAFGAIVPHTADGAVLLGTMAPHTANAGQVYFPCGTPDRDDVRPDDTVDLGLSAERELCEETGLALPEGGATGAWRLARGEGQFAFLRPVRFTEAADALVAEIEAHRGRQDRPELSGIVVARGRGDIDAARMPGFVQAYLRAVFR